MTYTYDLSHLPEAANAVLSGISGKKLLFYGDMGVGKTTLIKEIVKQLGYSDVVNSPTFSLVNEYEVKNDKLYHFDFYRVNDEKEALDIGIEEYFYSDYWNFIEWPEKISRILPNHKNDIIVTQNNDGTRTLKIIACE
ncbi:tRNA (adenosine(37)-N6)-threonylcarbamoyltransferase complex ATPase subunit type 1 TsaE [uncultured Planktosalinus sp.]|uniref:tRNA (adenosine(37)-N6)-threonylcarbamoyltransferase complex ATPase subunit type 1 TsaE n=1 Tax=uncultured Planktosalinus sp. TaxID=1810935 RepID=UPI0030D9B755